jgi:hypothetical protein
MIDVNVFRRCVSNTERVHLHGAPPILPRVDAQFAGLDPVFEPHTLNIDLDTTLTVVVGNLYRMLARSLPRYETATRTESGGHHQSPTHGDTGSPRRGEFVVESERFPVREARSTLLPILLPMKR